MAPGPARWSGQSSGTGTQWPLSCGSSTGWPAPLSASAPRGCGSSCVPSRTSTRRGRRPRERPTPAWHRDDVPRHNVPARLEARWASFFERDLGWSWTYEPFDADGYIPDFAIAGAAPLLVEVRPVLTQADCRAQSLPSGSAPPGTTTCSSSAPPHGWPPTFGRPAFAAISTAAPGAGTSPSGTGAWPVPDRAPPPVRRAELALWLHAPLVVGPEGASPLGLDRAWRGAGDHVRWTPPRGAADVADNAATFRLFEVPEVRDHPAKFTRRHISVLIEALSGWGTVLDPFAGTGGIHRLAASGTTRSAWSWSPSGRPGARSPWSATPANFPLPTPVLTPWPPPSIRQPGRRQLRGP